MAIISIFFKVYMQTRFDPTVLSTLTEFNQGLIYGFNPEPSTNEQLGNVSIKEALTSSTGQYQDLYLAYQWLQDSILPNIRSQGLDGIDEMVFLGWMKKIHGFIAQTLTSVNYPDSNDPHSQGAGQFTKDFIMRWRSSYSIMAVVNNYLNGALNSKTAIIELQKYNVDKQKSTAFLKALNCANTTPNTILAQSERNWIDRFSQGSPLYFYATSKLAVLYHSKSEKLTEAQREAINAVVLLPIPPTLIPAKMKELAVNTLVEWKKLHNELSQGTTDLKKVAAFLAKFFYEFNNIHPFENANKRTSCCIMNLMLRSLNLPSILLRLPQERFENNPQSTVAFNSMSTTLDPMTALIESRIQQGLKQPFHHARMQELNSLQCRKSSIILTLLSNHPKFNLNNALRSVPPVRTLENSSLSEFDRLIASKIPFEQATVAHLSTCLASLNQKATVSKAAQSSVDTMFKTPESKEEQIQKKMEELTSVKFWKKKGTDANLQIWREFESKEEAVETQDKLSSYKPLLEVTLSRRSDNNKPVLLCKTIQIDPLLAAKPLATNTKGFRVEA